MVCLNLPEHLRYLPENIYLVGVIPGPTKPSTDQINHFLAIVVDELLDFWDPGVYYSRTALRPNGRLARAALVPVVADLLAARQLSGFGPHNHSRVLCSVCVASADDVEATDYAAFKPRDLEQHRANAKAWLEAQSTFEREELFRQTGVRHSELLRLEYWNPLLYTVVDTMHNLYLGILQRHIRTLWGINVEADDGDASGVNSGAAPDRPSEDKMAAGRDVLLRGSKAQLKKVRKAILYHLCLDYGLRRAGTISQLVKNLIAWVSGAASLRYDEALQADIQSAEKTLRGLHARSALPRKKKDVLIAMCRSRGLDITGNKGVLATRLLTWVSLSSHDRAYPILNYAHKPPRPADSASADVRSPLEAIGRSTLAAYVEDRSRLVLPSWLNAPPVAFGTKQHGKLSADQWRTLCVVNLPITLIRTWSYQEERRVKMLQNFLDLVEAVENFGLLEIDNRQIAIAEKLMQKYLDGVKELYKGAKIQPNHHLALHIGVFLRLFGPVHSWRSFVFERFNYYLQTLNTNLTFGELEMTFMMHSCRAASFRPLLRSPAVKQYLEEFSRSMHAAEEHDRRGMRLDAILRSASAQHELAPVGEPFKGSRPASLDSATYKALLERLADETADVYIDERVFAAERPLGKLPLPRPATSCSAVRISGVYYKPRSRSTGDSNVLFRHPSLAATSRPGRIDRIFIHTRRGPDRQDLVETFLVVRPLKELDRVDAALDPYRKYPQVGGRLYYQAYEEAALVLRTEDVLCHFAQTTMEHLVVRAPGADNPRETYVCRISRPCVHVRPLDRV
ncbi:hypothetical protein GY45DRAFT_1264393 [Cubamyces sp. BRFM 1775]|nr:hypothetical protein GY45DRAFT_1264393 [Cubamyces sp. BRFM 1775]